MTKNVKWNEPLVTCSSWILPFFFFHFVATLCNTDFWVVIKTPATIFLYELPKNRYLYLNVSCISNVMEIRPTLHTAQEDYGKCKLCQLLLGTKYKGNPRFLISENNSTLPLFFNWKKLHHPQCFSCNKWKKSAHPLHLLGTSLVLGTKE